MERFVLNITNYVSGFDISGFRHEMTVESEREEYLNYSSKPVKIVWYSTSNSPMRDLEWSTQIVQDYKTQGGREPSYIEIVACKHHMHRQEEEAESVYLPHGWQVEWARAKHEAEQLMADEINRLRREKGYAG